MIGLFSALFPLAFANDDAPPSATEQDHSAEVVEHGDADPYHHRATVGLKGLVLATPGEGGHWNSFVGPGLLVGVAVRGTPLEVEVAVAVVGELDQTGRAVPIDLLIKGVAQFERLDLFVGGGGAVTIVHHLHEPSEAHPGLLGSGGGTLWLTHDLGVLAEVDAGVTFHKDHETAPEVEGGLALVYGF